jgi:type II secretory pathway pseudopilin PulG
VKGDRRGFSLVEALLAVTLGIVLVALATSLFLAQNRFQTGLRVQSRLQESARIVTEVVRAELRSASPDGLVVASEARLVVRVPMAVGVVCARSGERVDAWLPLAEGEDESAVAGYALRSPAGRWVFTEREGDELDGADAASARAACGAAGADTASLGSSDFRRLVGVAPVSGPDADPGTAVLLFRATTMEFGPSLLHPGGRAFFRAERAGGLREVASDMSADAGFSFRLEGEEGFEPAVAAADLPRIRVVRLAAITRSRPGETGAGGHEFVSGWTVDVPLLNVR